MIRDTRFASDLEVKHFLELIDPLRHYVDENALAIHDLPRGFEPIARHVISELKRFGYVPNAIRLLVQIDKDDYEPFLTVRQRAAAHRTLAALFLRLKRRS